MHISEGELQQLRALRRMRDEAAGMLGAALIEFERIKETHRRRIADGETAERDLANAILQRLELPDSEDFTITAEGVVKQLQAGQWIDVDGA